ncbi:MAG: lipoyl synthase [Candidatus Omnitrophica bacterium]|nr:lipoyl synthase [Candidatus Omnitrophota bacterium]MBD3269281.1 lipoyl synthase [Candidatus Omnitrophota bacterium]
MKKPYWLDKKINLEECRRLRLLLRELCLHTVCEESLCPNLSECFGSETATFMILGNKCSRSCSFCNVSSGIPAPPQEDEPLRIKEAVRLLSLKYVVVTSPTRDDLDDGGAGLFFQTAEAVYDLNPDITIELLIPDFKGDNLQVRNIAGSKASVIGHNIETVPSLYIKVRSGGGYLSSLRVLETLKEQNSGLLTKSGLMLGLGESVEEVKAVLKDLKKTGCDFLTLGQYLPPSLKHYPPKRFMPLEIFSYLKEFALNLGFKGVASSPYVRSSYKARQLYNNCIAGRFKA